MCKTDAMAARAVAAGAVRQVAPHLPTQHAKAGAAAGRAGGSCQGSGAKACCSSRCTSVGESLHDSMLDASDSDDAIDDGARPSSMAWSLGRPRHTVSGVAPTADGMHGRNEVHGQQLLQ